MQRYHALEKIVQLGSFSQAADELECSQSAVSQMVASLEKELGIKLLNRSRFGATLSLEGQEIYPLIEQTLTHWRATQTKAEEILGLDSGVIRIGAVASITRHWIPTLIAGFRESYPHVEFAFRLGDYTTIQDMVRNSEVDFGFVAPESVNGLERLTLKDGEMLAIVPPHHRLATRSSISIEELRSEDYILLGEGNYAEPLEAFKEAGIRPRVRYTVDDDYTITTMVEAGLGVSILSELILRAAPESLVRLHINPPLMRTIGICYRSRATLPIAAQRFITYMQSRLDELP